MIEHSGKIHSNIKDTTNVYTGLHDTFFEMYAEEVLLGASNAISVHEISADQSTSSSAIVLKDTRIAIIGLLSREADKSTSLVIKEEEIPDLPSLPLTEYVFIQGPSSTVKTATLAATLTMDSPDSFAPITKSLAAAMTGGPLADNTSAWHSLHTLSVQINNAHNTIGVKTITTGTFYVLDLDAIVINSNLINGSGNEFFYSPLDRTTPFKHHQHVAIFSTLESPMGDDLPNGRARVNLMIHHWFIQHIKDWISKNNSRSETLTWSTLNSRDQLTIIRDFIVFLNQMSEGIGPTAGETIIFFIPRPDTHQVTASTHKPLESPTPAQVHSLCNS